MFFVPDYGSHSEKEGINIFKNWKFQIKNGFKPQHVSKPDVAPIYFVVG